MSLWMNATYDTKILTDGVLQETYEQASSASYDLAISPSATAAADWLEWTYSNSNWNSGTTYTAVSLPGDGSGWADAEIYWYMESNDSSIAGDNADFNLLADGSVVDSCTIWDTESGNSTTYQNTVSVAAGTSTVEVEVVDGNVDPGPSDVTFRKKGSASVTSTDYTVNGVTKT